MTATAAVRADLAREIARATRALAVAGLFDMHGHISVRDGDVAYINSRGASRLGFRPEEIAVVRVADGGAVSGEAPSETALHLAIYRARRDVQSVSHFHPLYATAFAVAGKPLVTAFNAGAIFGDAVPVFDDPDLVQRDDQGREMATALGERRAVLLRGHGAAVAGEDIPSCVTASLFLEESARRLHAAYGLGTPRPYTKDEIARVAKSLWRPFVIEKTWNDTLERARRAGVLSDLE